METLREDGFDVWTPVHAEVIRNASKNVRREVTLPLLPSFIFANDVHRSDLLNLAALAEKPRRGPGGRKPAHCNFSVFHYQDKVAVIEDRELEFMRGKETLLLAAKDRPSFDRGRKVRVTRGAFEGLKGRVERCKQGYALVIFTDWKRPVKIPTFLLHEYDAPIVARGIGDAA